LLREQVPLVAGVSEEPVVVVVDNTAALFFDFGRGDVEGVFRNFVINPPPWLGVDEVEKNFRLFPLFEKNRLALTPDADADPADDEWLPPALDAFTADFSSVSESEGKS